MHLVVPSLTEQDCVVLDSAAISCSGLDGTGLAELLRIALLCTALDWTRLDCYWLIWTWATLDLNVLGWKGINWNWTGTDGNEQDWTGRDWTGLDGHRFHRVDWTASPWIGPDWTEPDSTSDDWTGRHCTSLDWTLLVWAWLHQTRIHCTTLDWTGKYHTGKSLHLATLICTELHSTFPNETDKDCTALYMNVIHWTRPHRIA